MNTEAENGPPRPFDGSDVSVIIPAYTSAATIGRALAGVGAQTTRPGEVIVVDDGSPDGTAEAAEAARGVLGGVPLTVLRQANGGAGAARNRGIEAARGRLLAFLDADDEWLPAKLERSLARLEATGAVLVAHDGWIVDAAGNAVPNETARRFAEGPDPFVALYRKGYIDTCTVVARRDAVIAAGGFDETLPNAQDFELWLAMLEAPGTAFEVFAEPLARYHLSPGGIMSHTDRRLRCCLTVAARYAPALAGRAGGIAGSLAFRVLAVHAEAARAHADAGRYAAALRILAGLPWRWAATAYAARGGSRPGRRPSYLRTPVAP